MWRKRRRRRFTEEVETSAAAARSTSSTAVSGAPIPALACGGGGGGRWGIGVRRCGVCAAAAKDCAAAGRVGEDCQVDWGLRLVLVDYRRNCMTCGTFMSGDAWLTVMLSCGSTCKWLEGLGLGLGPSDQQFNSGAVTLGLREQALESRSVRMFAAAAPHFD